MNLSPDGHYYLAAARGETVPSPYSRRWLLPEMLGSDPKHWAALTYFSLLLTPLAAYWYTDSWKAAALLCALPGVWRCSLRFPVLVDAPSFTLTLMTAAAVPHHPILGALLSVLSGGMKESNPLFAALWSCSPIPLFGIFGSSWLSKSAPPNAPWLEHPVQEALRLRAAIGLDASLYLRPFGAALLGLSVMTPQMAITLLVAHAQLFMAQDTIRLAVWAAPVLVIPAVAAIPSVLFPVALLITIFSIDRRV